MNASFRLHSSFMNASFRLDSSFMNASFRLDSSFMNASFRLDSSFMNASFRLDLPFVNPICWKKLSIIVFICCESRSNLASKEFAICFRSDLLATFSSSSEITPTWIAACFCLMPVFLNFFNAENASYFNACLFMKIFLIGWLIVYVNRIFLIAWIWFCYTLNGNCYKAISMSYSLLQWIIIFQQMPCETICKSNL